MIVKNMFGGKIMIPFGDFEPEDRWLQGQDGIVYGISNYGDVDLEDYEDFGKFSPEGYKEILEGWKQFKEEYYYDHDCCHWWDRKDPWAMKFFGELINSIQ